MDRIAQALKRASEDRTFDQSKNSTTVKAPEVSTLTTPPGTVKSAIKSAVKSVAVPQSLLRKKKILCDDSDEPIVDAYRLLRTRVLRQLSVNNRHSLGLTSTGAQEGKSLTAINLGIAIAMEPNHSAIVVDTDLRRPSIHKYFGLKPEHGISDYLNGNAPLEQILLSPGIERFCILPCLDTVSGAPEQLKSSKMRELVENLKRLFPEHIVIYDLSPVLIGDDAVGFSSLIDAMILVVEEGKTEKHKLKAAKELLAEAHLIGTVLNKVTESHLNSNQYY